jgi:uncharacterized membrane protein YbhN (UPF0104 family)
MRDWLNSWWFKVACTVLLIALLLAWVKPGRIWASLAGSNPWLLALSLAFTPVVIGVKTLRWLLLARIQDPISFKEALGSYLAGLALAVWTPLAAGEAGRGLFVHTGDRAGLTGKVILDKLVDLSTVSIFASFGLLMTEEPAVRGIAVTLLVIVTTAWSGMLLLLPRLEKVIAGVDSGWMARLQLPAVVSGLARTPYLQLALNMALSLVGFTVFYGQAFVLMRAFWAEAPWIVVPYFPIITLSTILSIAIGGVGIREWMAVLLLEQFGVAKSVAFNTFFVHFVMVQALPAVAGAVVIGSFRRREAIDPQSRNYGRATTSIPEDDDEGNRL